MSLLLDALRRSRSGGETPDKSGRTAHADQVLATLGYAPQSHRPRAVWIAIVAGSAAVLAALVWWGLPFLMTGSQQPQRQQARQVVQPRPTAGAGKPAQPQQPRPAPELVGQTPGRVAAPPPPSSAIAQRMPAPPQTLPAPVPQRPPIAAAQTRAPQVSASPSPTAKRGTVTLSPAPPRETAKRGTVTLSPAPPRESVTVPLSAASVRRPPLAPAAPPAVEPPRPDDFRLALYYQRSGDFERALTHYRAVLERNELNAEAHNNLGLLYQQKGLEPDSVREFQRAIAINPRYARAHNNLGVAWMRAGNLDLAQAEFQAALSVDSSDTDALVNLALAQKNARRPEAAKTTLLRALSIDPAHAAAHYNLALLYDESGEAARAVEHYRDFLEHAGVEHADLAPEVRQRVDQLAARLH